MLDLRDKRIEELPRATVVVLAAGELTRVTGRVVAQTYETDPMLDVRLPSGGIVQVRESQAEIRLS